MANRRLYYAVQQAGVSRCGENVFTSIHGLQSFGKNTKFNLEQIFELGQVSLYENSEITPDIDITMEKVLDGYPLIYHLATKGAVSPTIGGRSNVRSTVGWSVYSDEQDSASGTPLKQMTMSGVYVSSLNYDFQVQGAFKESVTLVGNNLVTNNTFTASAFLNNDSPAAPEGVNQKHDFLFGSAGSLLPTEIPGVSSSGTNELTAGSYGAHVQSIKTSANFGREAMYELGRRGAYHRYMKQPLEVKTEIEVMSLTGDNFTALEEQDNLTNQRIVLKTKEGTTIDLGSKNKLESVSYGGANAGSNGGNATNTFSYMTWGEFTVTHPADPSGL